MTAPSVAQPVALDDPRPHPALVGADWGDAYGVEVAGRLTARQALDRILQATPGWITDLLAVRNRITGWVGLKSARMMVGEGGFPVVSQTDTQMVLGLDDRHLDFRLVLMTSALEAGRTRVVLATLIRRRNLGGRLYLAAVLPFHRVIVQRMLAGL